MKNRNLRKLAIIAMLSGIMIVMQVTGIGMIPLPMFKLTVMHIPVILGAIVLGPGAGAILGCVFGLCSIWANTTAPGIMSVFFSPFLTVSGIAGAAKAVWVSLCCRILMGLLTGWIWRFLGKLKLRDLIRLPITAVLGTLLNTVLVLGSICLLFPSEYAQMNGATVEALFSIVGATVATNGLAEALAAAVLVTGIGKPILHFVERRK